MKKHCENVFEPAGRAALVRGYCQANYKIIVLLMVIIIVAAAGVVYAMRHVGRSLPYEYVMSIGSKGTGDGQFLYVEDFAIDSQGYLYATDALNSNVQVFRPDGTFDSSFAGKGTGAEHMKKPEGIAIDSNDDDVYVCEISNNRVQKFDKNGSLICMWGAEGKKPGEFGNLHGIIVDGNGNVYVADTANHRI